MFISTFCRIRMTSRKMTKRKSTSTIPTTHRATIFTTPPPPIRTPAPSPRCASTSRPRTTLRTDSSPLLRRYEKLLWIIQTCKGLVNEDGGRRGQGVEAEVTQGQVEVNSRTNGSRFGKKR